MNYQEESCAKVDALQNFIQNDAKPANDDSREPKWLHISEMSFKTKLQYMSDERQNVKYMQNQLIRALGKQRRPSILYCLSMASRSL